MPTLYEMTDAAHQLYEMLENGEIDEQTVRDTMEAIGASEKLESYVYVQKQLESEIAAYQAEIERMSKRVDSLQKHVDRMCQAQIEYMQASGQKSANAGTFKLTMRESKSCEITDADAIPLEYMREIPAKLEPDKKQMLKDMKDGKRIDGASLKTSCSVTVK